MKKQIVQTFRSKATAFAWVMEMVQSATIGDVNTNSSHQGRDAISCETEDLIYIAIYA